MAEKEEIILLKIQLEQEEFVSSIRKAKEEVARLKEENKALAKDSQDALGKGLVEAYNQVQDKIIQNNAAIKFNNQIVRENENVLVLQKKAIDAESGSYEQLLRQYQLAQIELKNQEGTLKKNADGTFELTDAYTAAKDQVVKAKDAIINFDQGIKDGRTNVGNYEASIKKAFDQLPSVTAKLNDINKNITDLNVKYEQGAISSKDFASQNAQLIELLNGTSTELQSLNSTIEGVGKNTEFIADNFKSLKERIKEARDEAQIAQEQFDKGLISEKELIASQQRVANLNEELSDFNKRIEALNPEAKFKAFTQAAASLAGGLSSAVGLMGLLGDSSDETQQALLKVQSALAFASGLNQLAELGDAFKNIKVVLGLTATAQEALTVTQTEAVVVTEAETVATGELAVAEEGAAVASGTLGTAITTMLGPIGIAVLAIGAAVTALALMSSSAKAANVDLQSVGNENKFFAEQLKSVKETSDEHIKSLEASIKLRREEGASQQELSDLQADLLIRKKTSLIDERILTQQHFEALQQIETNFSKIKLEDLSEEDRKKTEEQIKANKQETDRVIEQLTLITAKERTAKTEMEAQKLEFERQTAAQSTSIKIALIRDEQTREIAAEKNSLEEKLNLIKGFTDQENQLRENLRTQSEENILLIRRKFQQQEIEEENKIAILSTVENTTKRVQAEILAEQRTRDFKLTEQGLTESKRQLIIAESEIKIRQLQDDEIRITKERNEKLLELEQKKKDAIISLQQSQSDQNNPTENLAVDLVAIQNELQKEIQLKENARQEDLRNNEKYIDDQIAQLKFSQDFKNKSTEQQGIEINKIVTEGRQKEVAINEAADAEIIESTGKAARETRDTLKSSYDQRIQDLIAFEQLKADATGNPDEQLQAQLNVLDLQEEAEIDSLKKSAKNEEEFQAKKFLTQAKYQRQKDTLIRDSEIREVQGISNTLGTISGLMKKGSAEYKAIASAQAIIDTYAAANAAYFSALKVPVIGLALAPVMAALAVVTGLANVAKINSVDEFAEGGMTVDKVINRYNPKKVGSFEEGGRVNTPSIGLIGEKGPEHVTPNWMVEHPKIKPIIMGLETIRTTKTIPFEDGGFTAATIQTASFVQQNNLNQNISNDFQRLEAAITNLQVVATIEDINFMQERVKILADKATI